MRLRLLLRQRILLAHNESTMHLYAQSLRSTIWRMRSPPLAGASSWWLWTMRGVKTKET